MFALVSLTAHAEDRALSDAQVRSLLIDESVKEYLSTVGNCPCPYNRMRNGRSCGKTSAWNKPGGEEPLCYPRDVTDEMVAEYRASCASD